MCALLPSIGIYTRVDSRQKITSGFIEFWSSVRWLLLNIASIGYSPVEVRGNCFGVRLVIVLVVQPTTRKLIAKIKPNHLINNRRESATTHC